MSIIPRLVTVVVTLVLTVFTLSAMAADKQPFIKIGVLSHRGDETTLQMWNPTAVYLTQQLPEYDFEIIPLDFDESDAATRKGEIDFILVNPGIYVNLETRYHISRLATMNNLRHGAAYNVFGGVIFTRADRNDIFLLEDLPGKSFMAVDKTSLGGFQMAWRELNAKGINPYQDFSRLEFGGIHDYVVRSVLDGRVDAGTVRTDILERMAAAGTIDLNQIKIINSQYQPDFPFELSTRLYPEWPFSKVAHTDNELAHKVALALLQMPRDHEAARAGSYAGWTIPLDYQKVHDLFKELKLSPYNDLGKFTVFDALKRYWLWVLSGILSLIAMIFITSAVMQRNKRLEISKMRLQKRHELILNSVGEGIYGVDLDGRCTFVNHAMEELTGWQSADLIGENQHMILHHTREDGTHHPPHECPVYFTFTDDQPRYIEDDIFWKKDGSSISVAYSCTPIKDSKGVTTGSVVVFRDITERKQIAKRNREHNKQMEHVARLSTLGEMASGIAHELNQPLTAISTNSRAAMRMLESGNPMPQSCSDVMLKIANQAERAGSVIRHIRNFVHKELPERKPVRIKNMLDAVQELVGAEIRQKSIRLKIIIDENVNWVLAQDIQIEQVILNLVRNAIEALETVQMEERRLTIKVSLVKQDLVEIRVTDNGPGVNEGILADLFEPFISTKLQGMGLGLSISQGIVHSHGDQLRVDSQPGQGASFYFCLPVAESPDVADVVQHPPAEPTLSRSRTETEEDNAEEDNANEVKHG